MFDVHSFACILRTECPGSSKAIVRGVFWVMDVCVLSVLCCVYSVYSVAIVYYVHNVLVCVCLLYTECPWLNMIIVYSVSSVEYGYCVGPWSVLGWVCLLCTE